MTEASNILPVRDATSEPWFEALAEGKLLLQRDPETGAMQGYPRARVLGHPEREPEWVEASGRGRIHSFTVVERSVHPEFRALTPFVIALVDLEEGVRMTAWIVDMPPERLACDLPVRAVFRRIHSDLLMPCFTGN